VVKIPRAEKPAACYDLDLKKESKQCPNADMSGEW
jgi:hypothetical protein